MNILKFILFSLFSIAFVGLGILILAVANHLGFDATFPRGAIFLILLDLAVLKGFLLIQLLKDFSK